MKRPQRKLPIRLKLKLLPRLRRLLKKRPRKNSKPSLLLKRRLPKKRSPLRRRPRLRKLLRKPPTKRPKKKPTKRLLKRRRLRDLPKSKS